jgi:hypothetical protein
MGILFPSLAEFTAYQLPASWLIITQPLRLYWFRVKRDPIGNLLPRVGESKSKYNIPDSRHIITQAYRPYWFRVECTPQLPGLL